MLSARPQTRLSTPACSMSRLPKLHIQGHVYFVTTGVYQRVPIFTKPSFIIPLYDSLAFYRHQQKFKLLGYVIMPDHIHLVVWPHGRHTLSDFMRDFKEFTSKRIMRQAEVEENIALMHSFRLAGAETGRAMYKVWQDDFFEKHIFTERVLRQKLHYIHRNPVRAGLVETPDKYAYSSYRNYELDDNSFIEIDRDWY